jgi:dCTP deaminase
MAIYSDRDIRTLCTEGLVEPYDPSLVNPASLDVRLGPNLLIENRYSSKLVQHSIANHSAERPYRLRPGQFVLAETLEILQIPETVSAQFMLKSSRAREGIQHLLAGYADSGFRGRLTLELYNARYYHPVSIWPGMRIGQLVIHHLTSQPEVSYSVNGHYVDDLGVQASKGHFT